MTNPNPKQEPEVTSPKHAAEEAERPKTYFLGITNKKEADRVKEAALITVVTLALAPVAPLAAAGAAVGGAINWLFGDDDE